MKPFLSPASTATARRPAQVLVVEDEHIVAPGLQVQLEEMGYEVPALAASGEEAVRLVDALRPDLVLMDVNLDGRMDGVTAAGVIHDCFRLPVVFLTAYADPELVARAKLARPFGFVVKPYEGPELAVAVAMALYRAALEQQLLEQRRLTGAALRGVGDGVGQHEPARAVALLAAIVASSEDAIVSTTPDGVITSWNRAAERLYGHSAREAVGRPLSLVLPPERQEEVPDVLARVARGERVPAYETVRRRKDGSRVEVLVSASPVHDDEGRVVGAATIARDVTHLRQRGMEAAGRRAVAVARELNNVLQVIQGHAELAKGDLAAGSAAGESLDTITAAVERAKGLVRRLLHDGRSGEG
jgi:two-component system cell cycle sensor histidine kinase/response regulator CckA